MKSLPGILIGIAVGVVAGVLLAPESGRKTRNKLSSDADSFFKDLQGQLQDGLDAIRDQYNDYVDQASQTAKNAAGDVKRRAQF